MSWGVPNRPKISSRVENRPIENDGTDGDIQIKGTALGAKLFAKWSGRWWDVPLSIDGVTKIGVTDSDYLSIDTDSVDIYKDSVKVAEFGSDITLKGGTITLNDGTRDRLVFSSSDIDMYDEAGTNVLNVDTGVVTLKGGTINFHDGTRNRLVIGANDIDMYDEAGTNVLNIDTGVVTLLSSSSDKLTLSSAGIVFHAGGADVMSLDSGNISMTGKIIITSQGTQNVVMGVDNSDAGTKNVVIGVEAGNALTSSSGGGNSNILIGYQAGEKITTGDGHICIGSRAGEEVVTSSSIIAIGTGALDSATSGNNIGIGVASGEDITDGQYNVLVGEDTNASSNASECVSIGYKAGSGYGASGNAGDGCVLIGYRCGTASNGDTNSIVIGSDNGSAAFFGKGSNTVVIGNENATDFYTAMDSGAIVHCGAVVHGLTAVLLTTTTLSYAHHSLSVLRYITVSADAQTLTLPAVQIGAVFIIVNIAADGGALLTITPNGSDKFLTDIAGGVGTDGNNISNTKATQNQGDFVKLVGMHADGWAITEIGGIWADE